MGNTKNNRLFIWVGFSLFSVLIIIVVLIYFWPRTSEDLEVTGYPVYISEFCASNDELIILRARNASSIPREYDVCRIGKDGQEQYVQPYPGKSAIWNKDTEKLYFLSEMEICEFDPITGQCQFYLLEQSYEKICAIDGKNVFLQQDIYGPVAMYLMSTGKEHVLGASGWVLDICDGHLLTWDVYKASLTCYNYNEDRIAWAIDLSEDFSSAPILCRNGRDLYLANREGGNIYVIPQFIEKSEIEKLEISAQVIGMVNAYDYIVYAVKNSQSIAFYALFSDGAKVKLTEWKEVNYYQDSSLIMAVHKGKLYCTVKTEEGLFSYDLKN